MSPAELHGCVSRSINLLKYEVIGDFLDKAMLVLDVKYHMVKYYIY